jgi:hypothetical protein
MEVEQPQQTIVAYTPEEIRQREETEKALVLQAASALDQLKSAGNFSFDSSKLDALLLQLENQANGINGAEQLTQNLTLLRQNPSMYYNDQQPAALLLTNAQNNLNQEMQLLETRPEAAAIEALSTAQNNMLATVGNERDQERQLQLQLTAAQSRNTENAIVLRRTEDDLAIARSQQQQLTLELNQSRSNASALEGQLVTLKQAADREIQQQLATLKNATGQELALRNQENDELRRSIVAGQTKVNELTFQLTTVGQQLVSAQKAQQSTEESRQQLNQRLQELSQSFSQQTNNYKTALAQQQQQSANNTLALRQAADREVDDARNQLALLTTDKETAEAQVRALTVDNTILQTQLEQSQALVTVNEQRAEDIERQATTKVRELNLEVQQLALERDQAREDLNTQKLVTQQSTEVAVQNALLAQEKAEQALVQVESRFRASELEVSELNRNTQQLTIDLQTARQETQKALGQVREQQLALTTKESEISLALQKQLTTAKNAQSDAEKKLKTMTDESTKQLVTQDAVIMSLKQDAASDKKLIASLEDQVANQIVLLNTQTSSETDAQSRAVQCESRLMERDSRIKSLESQLASEKARYDRAEKTHQEEVQQYKKMQKQQQQLTTTIKESATRAVTNEKDALELAQLKTAIANIQLYALSQGGTLVDYARTFSVTDPSNKVVMRLDAEAMKNMTYILMLYKKLSTVSLYRPEARINFLSQDPDWSRDKYNMIGQTTLNDLISTAEQCARRIARGELVPTIKQGGGGGNVVVKNRLPFLKALGVPFKAMNVIELQTRQDWEARNNQLTQNGRYTVDVQFSELPVDQFPRQVLHFEATGVHLITDPSPDSGAQSYFVQMGHTKTRLISLGNTNMKDVISGEGYGRITVKESKSGDTVKEADFQYAIAPPENALLVYNTPISAALTNDILLYASYLGSRTNTYKINDILIGSEAM